MAITLPEPIINFIVQYPEISLIVFGVLFCWVSYGILMFLMWLIKLPFKKHNQGETKFPSPLLDKQKANTNTSQVLSPNLVSGDKSSSLTSFNKQVSSSKEPALFQHHQTPAEIKWIKE